MRRLVASSLIVACASLSAGCGLVEAATKDRPGKSIGSLETFAAQDWEIDLPCVPLATTQSTRVKGRMEPLKYKMWSCEDSDTAYVVSTSTLPPGAGGDLDDVSSGVAQGMDGKLVKNRKVTYVGVPARDVRIESSYEGEPATAFGRVFVRQRVLFQLLVLELGDHTTKPPALFGKILRSLTFR